MDKYLEKKWMENFKKKDVKNKDLWLELYLLNQSL